MRAPGAVGRRAVAEPLAHAGAEGLETLTAREQEVLQLVAQGLSSKAIGRQLYLSSNTVNHHLSAIFTKLDVNTRAQAVAEAVQHGLL